MRWSKKILKTRWFQSASAYLLYVYSVFCLKTTRWQHSPGYETYKRHAGPAIIALWHGRLLMPCLFKPKSRTMKALISSHSDGIFIAKAVKYFGVLPVHGSSRRGAVAGGMGAIKALRQGYDLAITPDGPKGPRFRVKAGVVEMARATGCPIFPATWSGTWAKQVGSWDTFLVPLPFGRGILSVGEPIAVPPDATEAELETLRVGLENILIQLTTEADARMGQPLVEAA